MATTKRRRAATSAGHREREGRPRGMEAPFVVAARFVAYGVGITSAPSLFMASRLRSTYSPLS